MAKLRRELIEPKGHGSSGPGAGFDVGKTGDCRVGLVGFPSVGKSTLMSLVTGVESKVSEQVFTTLTCIPGEYNFRNMKVQLLDLPGIIEGAASGKGRGRQVISTARTCDLILITLDATKPMTHKKFLENELGAMGIRLNKSKPDILFSKKEKGGIAVTATVKMTHLDQRIITAICREYRINNADITIRCDPTVDELIDVIEGNRRYVPALYLLNKIDSITMEELELLAKVPHYFPISSGKNWNIEELKEQIWNYLDMIRIYTKPKGQMPNYNDPLVLPRANSSVEYFCKRIHKDFASQMNYSKVWGTSVKFPGQHVGLAHILEDEDVIQVVKKK